MDRITKEVRHELVMLPYYSVFDDLAYKVDGDTVTLFGAVTRPTLKSDAENVDMIGRGSRLKASRCILGQKRYSSKSLAGFLASSGRLRNSINGVMARKRSATSR